ncbi:MAG: hypothetical protein OXD50_00740 [Chloroflexi bacterium]|nr:hypothetical protein [Chloroflexota bacterium]
MWRLLFWVSLAAIAVSACQSPDERFTPHQQSTVQQQAEQPIHSANAPDLLPLVLQDEIHQAYLRAMTIQDEEHGFATFLGITGRTDDATYPWAELSFSCYIEDRPPTVRAIVLAFTDEVVGDEAALAPLDTSKWDEARAKLGLTADAQWRRWGFELQPTAMVIWDATNLLRLAKQRHQVSVRLPLAHSVANATFNLLGVFNTPIQPNLDWCGAY